MAIQTILYFASILLTFALTGWLAWYAWRHRQLQGSSAYARLALSECLWALAEILSVLSPSAAWALFWFQVRYLFGALIGVFWFVFALEYNGHQDWFSKRLLAGLFIIPFITQVLLWSNSLHGLWVQREAAFIQKGPFWIADITARIPGLGYLTHSFYTLLLTLAGIVLMLLTAWKMRREFIAQALMLAGAGLTALFFVTNSLFNLLPKMEFNPFTPGLGLSVLLISLAVFRFQFLKRAPAQEGVAGLTNLAPLEKRSLAIFILSFILFASGLAAASYLTYQNYEKQFRAQVESQLSAIAALKAEQLQNWRAERLSDANLFYQNKNFSGRVQAYLENPQASEAQAGLLAYLEKVAAFPEYDRVFLLDVQGVERISVPATPDPDAVPAALIEHAAASLASNDVIFLDFHRHVEKGPIYLSLLVPIFDPQDHQPLGVLVLRINPQVYLNPFIQRWPVPSASAETLLVRRVGEQVVYLNQLRFGQDAALNLRFPLTDTDLPATRAVLGETGIIEGMDYRGQAVIADLRAVPGSPWFLVSKMDTAEVFAPLRERLWQTLLFFGVLVLAAGAGLVLAWRQQQVRFYHEQVEAAETLRESEERFRRAVLGAPFPIMIHAEDGEVVTLNTPWTELTGYNHSDIPTIADWTQKAYGTRMDLVRADIDGLYALDGPKTEGEYTIMTLSGKTRVWDFSSAPIGRLPDGRRMVISMAMDVTERKRAEDALRETNEYLDNLFNYANAPIIVWDPQFKITRFNHAFEALTGRSAAEVLGQPLEILFPPAQVGASMELIQKTLTGERWEVVEIGIQHVDGSIRTLLWNSATLFSADGKTPTATIAQGQDITERKQAEETLKENERTNTELLEKLNEAQKIALLGSWEWDLITDLVWWSDETYRIFGVTPQDFTPSFEANGKFIHPDDLEKYGQAFEHSLQTGAPLALDLRLVSGDGALKHCHAMGEIVYNDAGQAIRFVGTLMDITERKNAEEAHRQSDLLFRALFELSPDAVVILDPHDPKISSPIIDCNAAACLMNGYQRDELVGQSIDIVNAAPYTPGGEIAYLEKLREAGNLKLEVLHRHKSGSIFPVEVSTTLIKVGDRELVIGIDRDITERKRADEALKASELRFRLAAESLTDVLYEWDLKDRVDWFGDIDEIMGYPSGEFPRTLTGWASMLHPEDKERVQTAIDSHLKGIEPYMVEYRVRNKGGEWRWWSARGIAVRDERGEPYRWIGSISDITERKQAEEALKKSEKKYRQLHESMMDGFVSVGMDGKFLECNQVYRNMLGYSEAELAQLTYLELTPEKWHTYEADVVENQIMKRGYSDIYEKEYRRKDGTIFPVELHTVLSRDENGNPANMWAIARDITKRKRAEEILRESERKLREAQKMAHLGFWFWDIKTGYVEWSEEVFKIFGLDPKEFTPQIDSILALSPWPEDHQRDQEIINRAIENHDPGSYEQKFLRPDQSIGHYYSTFQGNYAEDGELISIVGTVLDITERKQAEEKLVNSEIHYRRLFEAARDGILILDAESGVVTDVNAFMVELLGFSHEVFLGKKLWELGFFKDIAANQENYRELLREDYIRYEDLPLETAQGRMIDVEFVSNVYQVDHHKVVQCNIRDITERKQAENALRESEDKFKHVFEYSSVGKSITQFNGGMQVNQALCDLLGYSMPEMQAQKWQEITHPDDVELTQREIDTLLSGEKESVRFVKRFIHKDGTIVWVDLSSSIRRNEQRQPLYLMSSVIDITERKRAEEILQSYSSRLEAQVMERTRELRNTQEQLVRQERLATLGQLAGSIGHELRNPLGVISNAIYYLKMSQPEASDKVKEYLDIIEKETRTSNKIVTDLLDFTRIKSVDRESASVSELVRQTLERYPAPPSVQVTLEIPADLPQIYTDPQQVVQVLGNLLTNACQAMATARSLEQTKLTVSAAVQSDMICIGIQDTGPGIPPENIDKLFQPLFTTKTKGIGLGLAVSKKLVEANGGRIEVESVVGQGSTFTVYLPVYKK